MAGGYWRRRAEANMDAVQDAAGKRIDRIGDAYLRAARDLTAEVEKIIGRYADRFKLTREEALEALKKPFDRDGRAYGYRMSRAEALRESARLKAQELGAMVEKQTAKQIAYTTDEGYRLARKALKELGATASFAEPDMAGLKRSLETGWKGASYSQRVWSNVDRLARTLEEEVTAGFLSGKSNAAIEELITNRFGCSFREAERLVRTETSYVHNQAALQSYKDARVGEYEFLTAKDSRTCKLCGGMDGKRFDVAEAEVGVNMPPMHPFCRCTVVPVVDSDPYEYGFSIFRSVGAKAANYDIVDKRTGKRYHFTEGTRIRDAKTFAGYGGLKPLNELVVDGLCEEFGGERQKWSHRKGVGSLDVNGEPTIAEIHWFQEETVGKVKFVIKEWKE